MQTNDTELLQMALVGSRSLTTKIEGLLGLRKQPKVAREIVREIGDEEGVSTETETPRRHRKPLSAAARKRISAAQKARWAAFRKKGSKAA